MSAFKAYDFRGVFGKDYTLDDIYRIGFFLPELLNVKKILVGRDMRLSTPAMFEALTNGITDAGCDVYDMGLTTTPMVYYFTAKHNFDASVMITASHNPKEYNGLKVSRTGALPVGYDTGLGQLEQMIKETPVPAPTKGKIFPHDVKEEYLAFQRQYSYDISNLKIAMDCSNGMATILVKDLFGTAPVYLYDELDGTFPHHEANPLEKENMRDLQQLVLKEKADIGVIFDGDADRVLFVDEKGEPRGYDKKMTGWSLHCPTLDLYNAFEEGDPRRGYTIIERGEVFDGFTHFNLSSPSGFQSKKEYCPMQYRSDPGNEDNLGMNLIVLRYSDILLYMAEACNELGKGSEALQYLEMVRARARNSGSDKNVLPRITETNQSALRELIYKERRVELAMEYNRYYDLARTGRLYNTMKAYYEKYEADPSAPGYSGQDKGKFVQPYHVHMPISNQALQASV